jgi:hypothetical protein
MGQLKNWRSLEESNLLIGHVVAGAAVEPHRRPSRDDAETIMLLRVTRGDKSDELV